MNDDTAPRDIVPRTGLTREIVEQLNTMTGRDVIFHEPGQVMCDLDGIPNAVEPSTSSAATLAPLIITRAEANRLGITEQEFENVSIVEID